MRKTLTSLGFVTTRSPPPWKVEVFHALAAETELIRSEEMKKGRAK